MVSRNTSLYINTTSESTRLNIHPVLARHREGLLQGADARLRVPLSDLVVDLDLVIGIEGVEADKVGVGEVGVREDIAGML